MVCEGIDVNIRSLFETKQYGRLFIVHGSHARGDTFCIQVLPKDEQAIYNGQGNLCLNTNAVLVYGMTGGQLGWTETYGWLIPGPWQQTFYDLAEKLLNERSIAEAEQQKAREQHEAAQEAKTKATISQFIADWPASDR